VVFKKKTEEGYGQKNYEDCTTKLEEKGYPIESLCCGSDAPSYLYEIALQKNNHDAAKDLQDE